MSSALSALQARFQDGPVAGRDDVLGDIVDSPREGRETLFGVYRHAYAARLVESLSLDYERLGAYLGGERFETLGHAYLAEHPSVFRSIRWFGDELPAFLLSHAPWSASPELHELAAIERALNDAFDAPDGTPLGLDALGSVDPADFSRLTFTFDASARRLDLATNARLVWLAIGEDREPPAAAAAEDGPERLLVWRAGYTSKLRAMPADEAMLYDEAARGLAFGPLCEMLATTMEPEAAPSRAATIVAGWLEAGLVTAIGVS